MSDWEWSSLQNIAFSLEDIAFTLQKMEQKMPVPEGVISTSTGPVDPTVELVEEELPEVEADEVAE